MPQIISITSEALQATIRRLLPSQRGFGEDLQASNVITPIIDVTPTAEGSQVGTNLQTAQAFSSQTVFDLNGTGSNIVTNAGFFQVFATWSLKEGSAATLPEVGFSCSDGISTKTLLRQKFPSSTDGFISTGTWQFVWFNRTGDSLRAFSVGSFGRISGSVRQIADVNGDLVNPVGFEPQ